MAYHTDAQSNITSIDTLTHDYSRYQSQDVEDCAEDDNDKGYKPYRHYTTGLVNCKVGRGQEVHIKSGSNRTSLIYSKEDAA
jgi:hypothetical protein